MKIETGDPKTSARYVCYMPGLAVPTVIRFWCVGQGWLNNLQEPVAGNVAGWIGPLPVWPDNGVRPAPPPGDGTEKSMEFDL